MTLTEFLKARLDEIAETADGVHRWEGQAQLTCDHVIAYGEDACSCGWPAWLLAEVEAKRRIVDEHDTTAVRAGEPLRDCQWYEWPCPTLRLLALPYAAHADYDPAWRP